MHKKLTAAAAAILAIGLAAPAFATGYGPIPYPLPAGPGFGPAPWPGYGPKHGYIPPPPPPNIFYGAVIEAEHGYLHCGVDRGNWHHPAYHPIVFNDYRGTYVSSAGRFVGNFTLNNYVEHYGLAAVPGYYTAFVYYSSPYPGTQIEFQVLSLLPVISPKLVSSADPRFNPNPWVFKYIAAPIPVWLPPGPFTFRVRNVTTPNYFNRGDTHFDYDKIVFGPLALPLPKGHWPCQDPESDECQSTLPEIPTQ
jgi:hypothetical protein